MNVEPLMRAAVEYAVFLGTSDDQTVQPDAAVAQLEQLAAILQPLGDHELDQFRAFVQRVARDEESKSGRTPRTEFLSGMVDNLGLA